MFFISIIINITIIIIMSINPIQDEHFRGCSRMGNGAKKIPPSLNSVTDILQWWNLAQLYLT